MGAIAHVGWQLSPAKRRTALTQAWRAVCACSAETFTAPASQVSKLRLMGCPFVTHTKPVTVNLFNPPLKMENSQSASFQF